MSVDRSCCCPSVEDMASIPMGDERHLRVFRSLELGRRHGGRQWWLSAATCGACGQHWMIAHDERIHDLSHLKRISEQRMRDIAEHDIWPDDFMRYEEVLRLGKTAGAPFFRFLDASSPALVDTAADLRRERPEMSHEEIADLLAITLEQAMNLFRDAFAAKPTTPP